MLKNDDIMSASESNENLFSFDERRMSLTRQRKIEYK